MTHAKKFIKQTFFVCKHCDSDLIYYKKTGNLQAYCLACNAPTTIISKEFKLPNEKKSPVVEYNPRYGRED